MAVTKEAVVFAYRSLLGREPETDQAIEHHMKAESETALARTILSSSEFARNKVAKDIVSVKSADIHQVFRRELQAAFEDFGYGWDKHKEASCDWITKQIPEGLGVDLGGTAFLVKAINAMPNRKAIFYDYFPPKDKGISHFVADDMDQFANHFDPGSLDFVTSRHTLEHALNPLFILWQINRSLKDKGKLIVVVPEHCKDWVWFYSHFSCLPRENWHMLFHRAGFKTVRSDAGTWQPHNPDFIEHRFVLEKETCSIRLKNNEYKKFHDIGSTR